MLEIIKTNYWTINNLNYYSDEENRDKDKFTAGLTSEILSIFNTCIQSWNFVSKRLQLSELKEIKSVEQDNIQTHTLLVRVGSAAEESARIRLLLQD